ncbi:MAG: helix-turn-helix domain-containing protein [Verrucomicrobiota bacterium]
MPLHLHFPRPPLSEFVDVMWLCEDYRPAHTLERILPDGTMVLVINLREDRVRLYANDNPNRFLTTRGSLVSGVQSAFHVIDTACQESNIGVHFKPGGAFPFFGLPANELRDNHATLDELWYEQAGEVREQLLEAISPADKFAVLEHAMRARIRRPLARHPAVVFALNEFQTVPARTVADVAGRTGLSLRRFIQVFDEEVGVTPKLYCRIRRFQEVMRLVHQRREIDWTEVGFDCGYFDQAHFIHDFRAFSGLNPTAYLAQRGDHFNHVPIAGES